MYIGLMQWKRHSGPGFLQLGNIERNTYIQAEMEKLLLSLCHEDYTEIYYKIYFFQEFKKWEMQIHQ
jgi:hypothetical protein